MNVLRVICLQVGPRISNSSLTLEMNDCNTRELGMGKGMMYSLRRIPTAVTLQVPRLLVRTILSAGENFLSFDNSSVLLDPGRKKLPRRHQGSFGGKMFGQASV